MMKKLLSLVVIAAFGLTAAMAQVCTPDPQYTTPGIYPDSATNLVDGQVGVAYLQIITAVVPSDTNVSGLDVTIDKIKVTNVTGLPPGIVYECGVANCEFEGGTSGCIKISGTPTQEGTFPIIVNTQTSVVGLPITQDDVIDSYRIIVGPVGVAEVFDTRKFQLGQNIPNPFTNETTIRFSNPDVTEMEFVVYDLLGKTVKKEKFMSQVGINDYKFNATGLNQGVYMYTLSNGAQSFTKRMVLSGK